MKYGFSFKGKHSGSVLGLTVKTVSRPVKPELRDTKIIVPYMDGAFGSPAANPYGRGFYNMKVFTVSMQLTAPDPVSLNRRIANISEWLTGEGILVFDDTPLIEWSATAADTVDYAPERGERKAVISVSFEVSPFGQLMWSVADGAEIGQDGIYLGDNIPIGMNGDHTLTMSGKTAEMSVVNYGTRYVRPIITVASDVGRVGKITVSANGSDTNKMTLFSECGTVIADCGAHTLTDAEGNNIMAGTGNNPGFSGRFIELMPGKNELAFERADASGQLEIKTDFRPAFLWDADFEETEWE